MQGFSMAVSSMKEGEKAVFTIPPELAGTKSGSPDSIPRNIPQNQALRFDIELISLVTVIDIFDDEGILKKIIKDGIGSHNSPRHLDEVLVNYNACMEDGVSVSKSAGVEFNLGEGFFSPAFAHAVKTMTEGEEAILIVKPEYGFGEQGRPSIGNEAAVLPDATLYVYLQLISWKTVSRIGGGKILKKTLRGGYMGGEYAENQSVVRVRLIGKLQDGVVFDQRGHERDEPFEFMVDEEQVSDSLEEAVLTMQEGEIAFHRSICRINLWLSLLDKDPSYMSRAESLKTELRKEKDGDKLFSSTKFLRAYRRYYKAVDILDWEKHKQMVKRFVEPQSFKQEAIDEIKQMLVSFSFKAAECAIKLQSYEQAKRHYEEIVSYDPGNVKAQQLAAQPFPEDSLGIDKAAMLRGCMRRHGCGPPAGASLRRLKQGHTYRGRTFFVPPMELPDANVTTRATTSDVNGGTATTNNENQNSGTITPPERPTVLASDGVLHHELDSTELKSEQGSK